MTKFPKPGTLFEYEDRCPEHLRFSGIDNFFLKSGQKIKLDKGVVLMYLEGESAPFNEDMHKHTFLYDNRMINWFDPWNGVEKCFKYFFEEPKK